MLDRLGVAITETVAAEESDELQLARQVHFFVEVWPEGAGGLVRIDLAKAVDGVRADLPLPRVEQHRDGGDEAGIGDLRASTREGERLLRSQLSAPGFQKLRNGDRSGQPAEQVDLERDIQQSVALL